MGPAAAIRAHHADAEITLLTTRALRRARRALRPISTASGSTSGRRSLASARVVAPAAAAARPGFARVYDLADLRPLELLFPPAAARDAAGMVGHRARRVAPARQSRRATPCTRSTARPSSCAPPASPTVPPPDLAWAATDLARFALPERFVAAGARRRRAPAGKALAGERYSPRSRADRRARAWRPSSSAARPRRALGAAIAARCAAALDLTGKTELRRHRRRSAGERAARRRQRYRPDASRRRRGRVGDGALFRRVRSRAHRAARPARHHPAPRRSRRARRSRRLPRRSPFG